MLINFVCVGSKMPAWVNQAYSEYEKRLNKDVKLRLAEIDGIKRTKSMSVEKIKAKEAANIQKLVSKRTHVVVLDVKGKAWSTEELALRLACWLHSGKEVSLIVGGPDGLDDEILSRADELWSLSKLTFPHPIVRVVVAEQIYRAWSVLNNHPYHRM
ncbi:MAG TPA: 23S rRNA (pseudouridine(1915)-N(3))-methyltransferase RlmH [Gammaproteobacteria bacterium]|nr:23S rRNA (pseudouridine(1915)-N(3))-methyltransferase RlmH [Gammaproteobacteria bacterium]